MFPLLYYPIKKYINILYYYYYYKMSTTVSCYLMGGLGNQLFQIFSTMSYAFDHKHSIVFPFSKSLTTGTIRPTYWDSFLQVFLFFLFDFLDLLDFLFPPINRCKSPTGVGVSIFGAGFLHTGHIDTRGSAAQRL